MLAFNLSYLKIAYLWELFLFGFCTCGHNVFKSLAFLFNNFNLIEAFSNKVINIIIFSAH